MAAQIFYVQPLKRALGGNIYFKYKLTPSFVGTVSSFQNCKSTLLDPFHSVNSKYMFPPRARYDMSDVTDDLRTRVIEQEPVEWRYHIGDDVFVTDVGVCKTNK
jgi:hypothetical protein